MRSGAHQFSLARIQRASLTIGSIAGTAFVILAGAVIATWPPLGAIDSDIHAWAVHRRGTFSVALASVLTLGGASIVAVPMIVVLATLAYFARGRSRAGIAEAITIAAVCALGMVTRFAVSSLVALPRPTPDDWAAHASGLSFPSGHTTAATILSTCCIWAIAPWLRSAAAAQVAVGLAIVYAAVVGATRIWLGVHWPTDVLGGWLYGLAWVFLLYAGLRRIRGRRSRMPS